MGPPVTPSPTPPADGLLVLSPSPQGARGIFGAQLPGMDSLKSRQWRYSTPPFDDRPSYGQASLVPAAQASSVSASIPRLADSRTPPSPIAFHHRLNLDDMKRNLFSPSPAGLMAQPWDASDIYSPETQELGASVGRNSRSSSHRSGTKPKAYDSRAKKSVVSAEESSSSRKRRAQLKVPKLELPLSEWAHKLPEVSVENIEVYVNRSLEERQQEAAGAGKIKRELNPFLLYRKAHKNVAEALIRTSSDNTSHINPRISKLCGVSWKTMESSSVRAQYETWSKIEKDRLKEAFPDYRYQPNKKQREDNSDLAVPDNYSQQNSLGGRKRGHRDLTPDMSVFGQTPPPGPDEGHWSRDYGSPGDFLTMDWTPPPPQPPPQQMQMNYVDDPFQHTYTRSPGWGQHAVYSHHPYFVPQHHSEPLGFGSSTSVDGIDPQLYYGSLNDDIHYQAAAEATEHVPPGEYLLSAPIKMSSSRTPSPEPLGQPWATSIPGNDLANDFLSGTLEDWEFGAGSRNPM